MGVVGTPQVWHDAAVTTDIPSVGRQILCDCHFEATAILERKIVLHHALAKTLLSNQNRSAWFTAVKL